MGKAIGKKGGKKGGHGKAVGKAVRLVEKCAAPMPRTAAWPGPAEPLHGPAQRHRTGVDWAARTQRPTRPTSPAQASQEGAQEGEEGEEAGAEKPEGRSVRATSLV